MNIMSTAYFPPVEYILKIYSSGGIIVDGHENYLKQTYRNRCYILTANGKLALTIPVIKTEGNHTPVNKIIIDDSEKWQQNHWRAIQSAYNSSPFFLFYQDEIQQFFETKHKNLFDFNISILTTILEQIGLPTKIKVSTSYEKEYPGMVDLRNSISPKKNFTIDFLPYFQVFDNKFGFTPNLSILDLLFNLGPETGSYLNRLPRNK